MGLLDGFVMYNFSAITQEQRDAILIMEGEEMEKCELDPLYFFNKYVSRSQVLTQEQYDGMKNRAMQLRKFFPLTSAAIIECPMTIDECFKPEDL